MEGQRRVPAVLADGSLGARFSWKSFYAEPYVRFGWPTGIGFGVAAGYRFGLASPEPPPQPLPPPLPAPPPAPLPPPPPPEPPPSGPPPVEREEPVIPEIQDLIFRANEADFAGRDADPQRGLDARTIQANTLALDTLAAFLAANGDYRVHVEGFANPVLGTEEEEALRLIPLSRARAVFVRDELVRRGVGGERITASGSGGLDAAGGSPEGNRRVRVRVYKTPDSQ
jgi:outer membrane protein OmpA-like peptidoglycan-associated protein